MGRAHVAKPTPHMFVITPDGKIACNGAIDRINPDRLEELPKATNSIAAALAALKAGKSPDPALTVPYGCEVKY